MSTESSAAAATSVAAVITAFNPAESLRDLLSDLVDQTSLIVIVDDGSTRAATDDVLAECENAGATILRLVRNSGIAAALNAGVALAEERLPTARAIVTFDQDSRVDEGYVAGLVRALDDASRAGIDVGLVAPESVEGVPVRIIGEREGVLLGGEPIQSGLLIPTTVLNAVGPFLESLFIDCVDTDYYMRVRERSLETVVARGIRLGHSLGSQTQARFLGRPVRFRGRMLSITLSAPFRYYYIARNRVAMNRRHGRRHPVWAVGQTVLDLRHFGIALALGPSRLLRLRVLVAGLADGARGRSGRIPPSVESLARRIRR